MIVSTPKQDRTMRLLREITGDTNAVYDGLLSISKEDLEGLNSDEKLNHVLETIAKYSARNLARK